MTAVFLRRGRCGFQNYLFSVKIKKLARDILFYPLTGVVCLIRNQVEAAYLSFANEVVNVVHLIKRNKPRLRQSS